MSAGILEQLKTAVLEYNREEATSLAKKAIEEKVSPIEGFDALTDAIRQVGDGYDREESLNQMSRALEEFIIEGISTTIPFHKQILNDKRFVRGDFNTRFLEHFEMRNE